MNRALALILAACALLLPTAPALAQSGARVVERISWVEEWDPATERWVRVDESPASIVPAAYLGTATVTRAETHADGVTVTETVIEEPVRFIARPVPRAAAELGLAQFGPFSVLDQRRAALVDSTSVGSPQAFAAMLAAYPGLEVIEFLDAPGTRNDLANLKLGRAIRAAGLATHVPEGGSARSGAVELFLAGTRRSMAPGALFAVHSWRDEAGREPADFASDAPANRLYLDYYAEMGMSDEEARAFYAMTNSVPHASALWLKGSEMAHWIAPQAVPATEEPSQIEPLLAEPVLLAALPDHCVLGEDAQAALALVAEHVAALPWFAAIDFWADPPPRLALAPFALLDSPTAFP
ncbi:alpha/beta hydrolase [Erythrobacter sp. NFXS35]|uniref:alpha/beta hydrolase n=1 Tax=Erythrobacter sp. NFXS35 TaxID=2818436 RepID=UPI0032DF8493